MKNEQLLSELIQGAVSEYNYQTGEDDFTAVVNVTVNDGWTDRPEIKAYNNHNSNCDDLHYWLNTASLAISAALDAVARIPANIDMARAQGVNKTLTELTQAKKTFTKSVANDTRSPDN